MPQTKTLDISEIFCSIQGEGIYTGVPSIFIRLQGCSSHCIWCDTNFGQNKNLGKRMTNEEILNKISEYKYINHIVITGGEPTEQMEGLRAFLSFLSAHFFVTVETNGTINPFDFDPYAYVDKWVSLWSVSPKLQSAKAKRKYNFCAIEAMLLHKAQLKFVISDEKDIEEMFELLQRFMKVPPVIIVQPNGQEEGKTCSPEEYSKRADWLVNILLDKYIDYFDKYDIRIMLQTHKVIWGNKRGM